MMTPKKNILIMTIMMVHCILSIGQNVGIGTIFPDASAQLEVSSTNKGFLPPRMTLQQRNEIYDPASGLVIWCGNCGIYGQIQVYNGFIWTNMLGGAPEGIPAIGDHSGGGIIAYFLVPGDPGYDSSMLHGFIAVTVDFQISGYEYGCEGSDIPGADSTSIGSGYQNTLDIVNECSPSSLAAGFCFNLIAEGYSDWYLPSKNELNKLFINRNFIGGFTVNSYWSSSEKDAFTAWSQDFFDGAQTTPNKYIWAYVRAIRSF